MADDGNIILREVYYYILLIIDVQGMCLLKFKGVLQKVRVNQNKIKQTDSGIVAPFVLGSTGPRILIDITSYFPIVSYSNSSVLYIENLIPPPSCCIILHSLRSLSRLLIPQFHYTSRRIHPSENISPLITASSNTYISIQIRIIRRRQSRQHSLHKSPQVLRVANLRRSQSFPRKHQLPVRSMEEIGNRFRKLLLDHLSNDRTEQRFEHPSQEREFGFAERV